MNKQNSGLRERILRIFKDHKFRYNLNINRYKDEIIKVTTPKGEELYIRIGDVQGKQVRMAFHTNTKEIQIDRLEKVVHEPIKQEPPKDFEYEGASI